MKEKVFHLDSSNGITLTKEVGDTEENIVIEGFASLTVPDRAGDVVQASAWTSGMENYLKNPIILVQHNHNKPVGKMIDHKISNKGLWIKARISPAAGETFELVKDGVISAFSVAFRIVEAEYNPATELFIIKKLELIEISVVSVPCNQDTLFELSKSFANDEDYKLFKQQYVESTTEAKGLESTTTSTVNTPKGNVMDPKDLEKLVAEAVAKASDEASAKAIATMLATQKAAEEAKAKAAAEEEALQARIKAAVAAVTPSTTGAEKLLADATKAIESTQADAKKQLDALMASIAEKKDELDAIQKSRMQFPAGVDPKAVSMVEKETAVLLSKVLKKDIGDLKMAGALREKVGQHLPSATWETEVSLNMEAEVRRKLVVAPILRNIAMQTNVMKIPVNPEAGLANWVTNAQFMTTSSMGGTTASGGTGSPHLLKEITLSAYKVATNEYVGYEEEEDSLLVLMPVIRDAMVRRLSRAVDLAFLRGAGTGGDPVGGLATYDTTSAVNATNTGSASIANLIALRKDLGAWGLDPSEIKFIVSTDVYYDLLQDTSFQTVDKIGDRATLLTGQVGTVGNSPVLVSAEFPTKAGGSASATTNYAAIAVAPANFMVGNQRGLRFDTQDLVETQRKVLVASLRTGMVQITTNMGQGVSVLRWS